MMRRCKKIVNPTDGRCKLDVCAGGGRRFDGRHPKEKNMVGDQDSLSKMLRRLADLENKSSSLCVFDLRGI